MLKWRAARKWLVSATWAAEIIHADIAPRLRARACDPANPSACDNASNLAKPLLWISASIYAIGFFAAYALGPLLTKLDSN
jgi:hypothetical protein